MPTRRLAELAQRKQRLVARSAVQRSVIAVSAADLERPLGLLDRGVAVARYIKARPPLVAAIVAGGLVLARFNVLKWVGPGLLAWRTWRTLSQHFRPERARPRGLPYRRF